MKLFKYSKLAFNILAHSKVRTWLSVVGIVIGVASVIIIMSLGQGLQQTLEENLGSLGGDMVTISPGFSRASGMSGGFNRGNRGNIHGGTEDSNSNTNTYADPKNITNRDVQVLRSISNIAQIQGVVSKRGDVGYLDETISATVKGIDTRVWKNIEVTKLESGRYLSQGDKNSVVISNSIAKDKFKQNIQLNRQVTIEGKPFRVVGILEASIGFSYSSNRTTLFHLLYVSSRFS